MAKILGGEENKFSNLLLKTASWSTWPKGPFDRAPTLATSPACCTGRDHLAAAGLAVGVAAAAAGSAAEWPIKRNERCAAA